jgi:hypothetical protein
MTGLPVRKAKPAGDARAAPTLAEPTTPSPQPNPSAHQKPILGRQVFQHFAVLRFQSFGCQPRGMIEQFHELRALQRQNP